VSREVVRTPIASPSDAPPSWPRTVPPTRIAFAGWLAVDR
jgi:hypothetical protein